MVDGADVHRIAELEGQVATLRDQLDRLSNLTDNPFYMGVVGIATTTPVISIDTYSN